MLNRDSRLRVFCSVALYASFTKAADQLCLTQQAVSFQVKSLEDEVGTKLFRRTSAGAGDTTAGRDDTGGDNAEPERCDPAAGCGADR